MGGLIMGKKRLILILSAIVMALALSVSAAFADSSKEADLTDVTGIRFEPVSPIVLEEWVDGRLDEDSHFFFYNYMNGIYRDGSTLILVKKDGSESRYVLDNEKKAFIGEDGTKIKRNALYVHSTDFYYDDEWKMGKSTFKGWKKGDHAVTVQYRDLTCDVTATVVENSIDKVEYIWHDPLIENYKGSWTTDAGENEFFFYNYGYGDQDMVRITLKDGTVREYTHKEGDEDDDMDDSFQYLFRCKDGTYIALSYYQLGSDQFETHWSLGSDNYALFYYGGKEYQSQVTITGSPIDSILYKPAIPITYRENFGLDERWDEKTQSSYYVYGDPKRRDGDKLTVVKNGKKKVYTYSSNKYAYINGKDRINAWDIDIHTYQKEKPWVLGSDNEVEFNYLGRACKVKVTVQKDKIENPMKASGKTVKVKYSRLKKKTQKIWEAQVFKVVDKEGFVTYKLAKKDKKAKNKITVSKDGTVTVKKGLKKGKYSIKVKVTASGNDSYKARTKTVTVKVNVK